MPQPEPSYPRPSSSRRVTCTLTWHSHLWHALPSPSHSPLQLTTLRPPLLRLQGELLREQPRHSAPPRAACAALLPPLLRVQNGRRRAVHSAGPPHDAPPRGLGRHLQRCVCFRSEAALAAFTCVVCSSVWGGTCCSCAVWYLVWSSTFCFHMLRCVFFGLGRRHFRVLPHAPSHVHACACLQVSSFLVSGLMSNVAVFRDVSPVLWARILPLLRPAR